MTQRSNDVVGVGRVGALRRRPTLREEAVEALRAAIAAGRLRAGTRYSVETLAAELGVSRTPVREALLDLESRGMVRFERNQGVRVLTMTLDDLREILTLRLLAEVPATYRAAQVATPSDLADLTAQVTAMRALHDTGDSRALLAADRRFHRSIVEVAGSGRLADHVERVRDLMTAHDHYSDAVRRDLDRHVGDHDSILDALTRRDPPAAADAARAHVVHIARAVLRHAGDPTGELDWVDAVGHAGGAADRRR